MFEQRVTEHVCLDATVAPCFAFAPEQPMPIVRIPRIQQCRVAQQHDNAAFVEMRQRALRARATFRSGNRDLRNLARIQRCLDLRKTQPDQRIQQVVPVALARGDFAALENALFVMQAVGEQFRCLRDEMRRTRLAMTIQSVDAGPRRAAQQIIVLAPL